MLQYDFTHLSYQSYLSRWLELCGFPARTNKLGTNFTFPVADINDIICFYLPPEDYGFIAIKREANINSRLISRWMKECLDSGYVERKEIKCKNHNYNEITISTYINGILESVFDQPSFIKYRQFGGELIKVDMKAIEESYHQKGELHRNENYGPAHITYLIDITKNSTGTNTQQEEYYKNGKPHRVNGPAIISYNDYDGFKSYESYFLEGVAHRDENDGPSFTEYNAFSFKCKEIGIDIKNREAYTNNDETHRSEKEGPAVIEYDDDGNKTVEEYWYKDQIHRFVQNGPAIIRYFYKNNKLEATECEYREYDRYMDNEEVKMVKIIRNNNANKNGKIRKKRRTTQSENGKTI